MVQIYKKIIFIFILVQSLFCSFLFASDFQGEDKDNLVYIDITDCKAKYVQDNTAWVKGNSMRFNASTYSAKGWTTRDRSGPNYSNNRLTFSCAFDVTFILTWQKANPSIDAKVYYDNKVSVPVFSTSAPLINGKFTDKESVSLNVRIPTDICDVPSVAGCGISSIKYYKDGNPYTPPFLSNFSSTVPTVTFDTQGNHSFSVCVTDMLGNTTTVTKYISIDSQSPVSSGIIDSSNGEWSTSDVKLVASAADSISGIDLNSWKNSFGSGRSLNISKEGIHNVQFSVCDFAGNKLDFPVKTVRIDKTKPLLSVSEDSGGVWKKKINVMASASDSLSGVDNESWAYSLDGKKFVKGNSVIIKEHGIHSVVFKVCDIAGNESRCSVSNLKVDSVPPELSFTAQKFVSSDSLLLKNFTVKDSISQKPSVFLIMDSLPKKQIFVSQNEYSLDISSLKEGLHEVSVEADDGCGNISKQSISFVKDKTPPVLKDVEFISAGKRIVSGDYLVADSDTDLNTVNPSFSLTTSINAEEKKVCGQEEISCFYYILNGKKAVATVNPDFSIDSFVEGRNIIGFYAVDNAGNKSSVKEFVFIKNSAVPLEPSVKSSTHKMSYNSKEGSREKTACISINGGTANSDISDIVWSFYKGSLNSSGKINESSLVVYKNMSDIKTGGKLREEIYFENLDDNMEGEFYCFRAYSVGKNGRCSRAAEYVFRIDTSPPKNFTMWLTPQVDSAKWYSESSVNINWCQGTDNTGIKNFAYSVKPVLQSESVSEPEWIEIENNGLMKKKITVFESSEISLKIFDKAGNEDVLVQKCLIDVVPPEFATGKGSVQWSGKTYVSESSQNMDDAKIQWGDVSDRGSGMDYILIDYGAGNNVTLSATVKEAVLKDLDENKSYCINVYAFDKAGNSSKKMFILAGKNMKEDETFEFDFNQNIKGICVSGKMKQSVSGENSEVVNASLSVPGMLSVDCENTKIESVPLDISKIKISEGEIQECVAVEPSLKNKYTVSACNWEFQCRSFGFTISEGFVFYDVSYFQETSSGRNQEIYFDKVTAGFPAEFVPESKAAKTNLLSVKTDIFTVKDIDSVQLSDEKKYFNGNAYVIPAKLNIVNSENEKKIPLHNISVSVDNKSLHAETDSAKSFYITENNIRMCIADAFVLNSCINVNTASFVVKNSSGDFFDIYVHDFILDESSGKADFSYSNFTFRNEKGDIVDKINFGNVYIKSEDVHFDSNGKIVCSGSLTDGENEICSVSDIYFDAGQIDFSESKINSVSSSVFGFPLEISDASVVAVNGKCGLLVKKGFITAFDKKIAVGGLCVNTCDFNDIICESEILFDFELHTDYGTYIRFDKGTVSKNGVTCNLQIPVPLSENPVCVNSVLLESDGSFSARRKYSDDEVPVKVFYGNYSFAVREFVFDGKSFLVEKGFLDCSKLNFMYDGKRQDSIAFTGAEFTYTSMTASPEFEESGLSYVSGNWELSIDKMSFVSSALQCSGSVYKEFEEGELYLAFNSFVVKPDGSFLSGLSTSVKEENILVINSIPVYICSSRFIQESENNSLVQCSSPVLDFQMSGIDSIILGNTKISCDGSIESDAVYRDFVFDSANGYSVNASGVKLDNSGIGFKGILASTEISGCCEYNDFRIRFFADGSVFPDSQSGDTFTYEYAGWEIEGVGFSNDGEYTIIEENYVTFRDVQFNLGRIKFDSDGQALTVVNEQNVKISFSSPNDMLYETKLTKNGIVAGFRVSMPSSLGNQTFDYPGVKIFPDGSCSSSGSIKGFSFELGMAEFEIGGISLSSNGLMLIDCNIFFSGIDDGVSVSIGKLFIENGCVVNMEQASVSPFEIWNCWFSVENFGITGNGISLSAWMTLPSDFPGILSERRIYVKELFIDWTNGLGKIDATATGEYVIPLFGDWKIAFSEFNVFADNNDAGLCFKQCGLIFPPGFAVSKVSVSDIKMNLSSGTVLFDSICAETDIDFTFGGVSFSFDELTVHSSGSVGFRGGASFDDEKFPEFLRSVKIPDAYLEFASDGSINECRVAAQNIHGTIGSGIYALAVKNADILFEKDNEEKFILDVSGEVGFTEHAPEDLANLSLKIDEFIVDANSGTIRSFKAGAYGMAFSFGGVRLCDAGAYVATSCEDEGFVSFTGNLVLPAALPGDLGGTKVSLDEFTLDLDGSVKAFSASYITDEVLSLSKGLYLKKANILAQYTGSDVLFKIDSGIFLDEKTFPSGLGGTSLDAKLSFDSTGLLDLDASCSLSDRVILNTLVTRNAWIGIRKTENSSIEVSLTGNLSFAPETKLPQAVASSTFVIDVLKFNSSGTLLDLKASASAGNFGLFNAVRIVSPKLFLSKGTAGDIIVDVGGGLEITAAGVPDSLKNSKLNIKTLRFSTTKGMLSFNAALTSPVKFTVLQGLDLTLKSLSLSSSGFTCSALSEMKFQGPMKGVSFLLNNFAMSWSGKILDINGGLDSMDIEIAGFKGSIEKLNFIKDDKCSDGFAICLKKCKVLFPANMGSLSGTSMEVENASFKNGKFTGVFAVSVLEINIAGFALKIQSPRFDFSDNSIKFSSVKLVGPELLNSSMIALSNVKINPSSGLSFSGGGFSLPDFSLGGKIGFSRVRAEFGNNNGIWSVYGTARMSVPNAGEMAALISFTNPSSEYPIGLKRAYFSFETAKGVIGIPIGTTGLYMSGIRGGLAYGAPDEVPSDIRHMFKKGIRIQLGLTVADKTGGSLVKMTPDTWIDVENLTWAFKGNLTVLKGSLNLSANASAVFSRAGLSTEVNVNLTFIKGRIELYIFGRNGRTMFSGTGNVGLSLEKGSLYHTSFKIFWKRITIDIPPCKINLGNTGVEFGDFSNGKRGFKASAYFDGFGTFGVFVSDSGMKIGDVSTYKIVRPANSFSNRSENYSLNYEKQNYNMPLAQFNLNVNETVESGINNHPFKVSENLHSRIISEEESGQGLYFERNIIQKNEKAKARLDRIVFVCAYAEGNPTFKAVSPSGQIYIAGDENVETYYYEDCVMFTVLSPENGDWNFIVEGIEKGMYSVDALTVEKKAEIVLDSPSGEINTDGAVLVSGRIVSGYTEKVRLNAYSEETGTYVNLAEVDVNEDGSFVENISIEQLADANYTLGVSAFDSSGIPEQVSCFSPLIHLNRENAVLNPPSEFRVWKNSDGECIFEWDENILGNIRGYVLEISDEETTLIDAGKVSAYTTSIPKGNFSARIKTVDVYGRESNFSKEISFDSESVSKKINLPVIEKNPDAIILRSGETDSFGIKASVNNFEETDDAYSYFYGTVDKINMDGTGYDASEFIKANFDSSVKIERDTARLVCYVSVSERCTPGKYILQGKIFNRGNPTLEDDYSIEINVEYPKLAIYRTEPSVITEECGPDLYVYGEGFVNGSRYYLDGSELFAEESEVAYVKSKHLVYSGDLMSNKSRILRIENPSGDCAEYCIPVSKDIWTFEPCQEKLVLVPGQSGILPVDFTGNANSADAPVFRIEGLCDGLEVRLPDVISSGVEEFVFTAADTTVPGTYDVKFTDESGESMYVTVQIVSEINEVNPCIASVVPFSAYAGDEVCVYGSNFNQESVLLLDGRSIAVSEINSSCIKFKVPDEMSSGKLRVKNGEYYSDEYLFYVLERGFSIQCKPSVSLADGIVSDMRLFVAGSRQSVELSVCVPDYAPFTAELQKKTVVPDCENSLKLIPKKEFKSGEWQIVVSGKSDNFNSYASVIVKTCGLPKIDDSAVYDATVNVPYRAALYCDSEYPADSFFVESGNLPSGLSLDENGIVYGVPERIENTCATIGVLYNGGYSVTKKVNFVVKDNSWTCSSVRSDKNQTVGFDIPSEFVRKWSLNLNTQINQILACDSTLIFVGEKSVSSYTLSANLRWKREFESSVSDAQISGNYLFVLFSDNSVCWFDYRMPAVDFRSENVLHFVSGDNSVLFIEKNKITELNSNTGEKLAEKNICLEDAFYSNGQFYGILPAGKEVVSLEDTGKHILLDSSITGTAGGYGKTVLVTESSVYTVDQNLKIQKQSSCMQNSKSFVSVTDDSVYVLADDSLYDFDSETLELNRKICEGVRAFATAENKIVVLLDSGTAALNKYDGNVIWKDKASASDFILYNKQIFLSCTNGEIVCAGGELNKFLPQTEIEFIPRSPDGVNGWYKNIPSVKINCTDKDGYVAETKVNVSGLWESYENTITPDRTEARIGAYGIDNSGQTGPAVYSEYKSDNVPPEVSVSLEGEKTDSGWYDGSVYVSLSGSDNLSGIDFMELNGEVYSSPVLISEEGIAEFEYYALDIAGNESERKSIFINIDIDVPSIDLEVRNSVSSAVVSAKGYDKASGIKRIEYKEKDGVIKEYKSSLLIMDGGQHDFEFRSVDNTGKTSEWKKVSVFVWESLRKKDDLILFPKINGVKRSVERSMKKASFMKYLSETGISSSDIPGYILESETISWSKNDLCMKERKSIDFYISRDSFVYLICDRDFLPGKDFIFQKNIGMKSALFTAKILSGTFVSFDVDENKHIPVVGAVDVPELSVALFNGKVADLNYLKKGYFTTYNAGESILLSAKIFGAGVSTVPMTGTWFVISGNSKIPLGGNIYRIPLVREDKKVKFVYELRSPAGTLENYSVMQVDVKGMNHITDAWDLSLTENFIWR